MFCTKCGNKIDDGAAFCCKCGAKLETASVENSASSNVIVKSKKDFIYERFCLYMTANPMIVGFNPTFGELENYEDDEDMNEENDDFDDDSFEDDMDIEEGDEE